VIDRWRAEALGLPPLPLLADRLRLRGEPVTRLYGVSRHLLPSPPDWDAGSFMTGAWFLDEGAGWTPPTGLAAFLAAGPPPVYVGFGSMAGPDAARLAAVALEALARAGQRAVLATGWGGLALPPALPDGVHALEAAPHDRLFPRMAAVVHHGGAGTTHEGLRWGRPTVICPVFGDQPFWGRRVAALGAGPPPLPHRGLTPDRVGAAIRAAVESPAIGRRAAKLGALVRAEPGVARAVEVIEEVRRAAG
jgi:sterol 3beta-glucosyltransferase